MQRAGWRTLVGLVLALIVLGASRSAGSLRVPGTSLSSVSTVGRVGDPFSPLPDADEDVPAPLEHTVAAGETLTTIAVRYGVDPRLLAAQNGIRNPDRIFPGQVLEVPEARAMIYIVQWGDTLSGIAARYHMDMAEVCRLNDVINPDFIVAGMRLQIPGETPEPRVAQVGRFYLGHSEFLWPVAGIISSPFGYRWGRLHTGIDIAAQYGREVSAMSDGTVLFAGRKGTYGNLVIIGHEGGLSSYYGHLSRIEVEHGMEVVKGEAVGRTGASGKSTGPHLHFEVRQNSAPINPRRILP